jgi:hypothetical protein
MSSGEWIGTLGVSILLIAFGLNLLKKLQANSTLYLFLNVLGGALACISSLLIHFWPFVVLEGVWAISSLVMLARLKSGK